MNFVFFVVSIMTSKLMRVSTLKSSAARVVRGLDRSAVRRSLAEPLLVLLVTLSLCWSYLVLVPFAGGEAFGLGGISAPRLRGFYSAETSDAGRGFRWTNGTGAIRLDAQGAGPHLLAVTLAAPRPDSLNVPVTLDLNGTPLALLQQGGATRRHHVLVPPDALRWQGNRLTISSPTFRLDDPQNDGRQLGVAVFELGWHSAGRPPWLVPAQAGALAVASALLGLLLGRAGIPLVARLLTLGLFLAIALSMRHSDTRYVYRLHGMLLACALIGLFAIGLLVVRPQPGDGALPWRAWLRHHWLALLGYTALTALMLFPVLPRLATNIPGHPGDAYEYLWKLQLFSDYLLVHHQTPLFLPELMYPEGFELAASEITPANTLLGLPLTWLWGPIVSFNLLNLASYLLSGFFTYLLIVRLGARRLAAWVGGIVFAFALRRTFQMDAGHLNLMTTQWLPLALYGLEGLITRRRNWDALVAVTGLALATWASLYYGTTFVLFMAGYALLRPRLRELPALFRAIWRPAALASVVLLALVAPFAQPYLEARQQSGELRHQRIHLEVHAAIPGDYLLTNPYHPLWGDWARQFHRSDGGEHFVALGYSTIALLLLGLALVRPRRLALALAILMAGCFVLTLGPFLRLPGGGQWPLPALFIYEHVPVLNGIRVWNRVELYIVLCAAVLAGLLLTRLPRRQYRVGTTLVALVLLAELTSAWEFTGAEPRAVDLWLRAQPGRGAVAELPIEPGGIDVYSSLVHQRPSNSWYGTFFPPLYSENLPALQTFPSRRALQVLQRWQTEYVVVEEGLLQNNFPDWQAAIERLNSFELMYRQDGYSVYRLRR